MKSVQGFPKIVKIKIKKTKNTRTRIPKPTGRIKDDDRHYNTRENKQYNFPALPRRRTISSEWRLHCFVRFQTSLYIIYIYIYVCPVRTKITTSVFLYRRYFIYIYARLIFFHFWWLVFRHYTCQRGSHGNFLDVVIAPSFTRGVYG